MTESDMIDPHRRLNPLTGEWVLVSPQRTQRPWQGFEEPPEPGTRRRYETGCYLCPGNERAAGKINPTYTGTYVFKNDFPALCENKAAAECNHHDLLQCKSIEGECRVVCFSPRHDLTLPELHPENIRQVIDTWIEQTKDLGRRYTWVQIFENKGSIMGCSNPHPHGQIWGQNSLPQLAIREDKYQRIYHEKNHRSLLMEYALLEMAQRKRIVTENRDWLACVPFWAVWPFETILLPKKPLKRLTDLDVPGRNRLSEILRTLLTKYDNLFKTPFPYSMGWHGAPFTNSESEHWQLHAHFFPPLLRSATVRKFMVGYEMLAEVQRDLTAETAAKQLRDQSDIHYRTL